MAETDTFTTTVSQENDLPPQPGLNPLIPVHDAILPYEWKGVVWGIPNVGDNLETESAAMAELFDITNRALLAMSCLRDCFVPGKPSRGFLTRFHNMYAQLMLFVDARTKQDNNVREDYPHITPLRHRFKRYPVRYFDQKNRYTKRWCELSLYGLSQMAQLAEANTWTNDWNKDSAEMIKRPFDEAYRLMCVEIFRVTPESFVDPATGLSKRPRFLLAQDDFNKLTMDHIPNIEEIEHPFSRFFTEDQLETISRRNQPLADGVTSSGGGTSETVANAKDRVASTTVI